MSFINQILLKLNLIHKKNLSKKHYFSFSGVDILIENIFRNQNFQYLALTYQRYPEIFGLKLVEFQGLL